MLMKRYNFQKDKWSRINYIQVRFQLLIKTKKGTGIHMYHFTYSKPILMSLYSMETEETKETKYINHRSK